jgi:hypothetical protein
MDELRDARLVLVPRSNRPRGRSKDEEPAFDLAKALVGRLHTEDKRDGAWNVQPLAAASAIKSYLCPGCGLSIAQGTAHIVSWRADGIMGAADDLAARRHWHARCWEIKR